MNKITKNFSEPNKKSCKRNYSKLKRRQIENQILNCRIIQDGLFPAARLEFWAEIMKDYCKHCGEREVVEKCQCNNDE